MIGTVKSEAIYAQIANLMSNHDDPWLERKTPLKELVRKAQELGGSEDASGLGTAFHGLTECWDRGSKPAYIPRQLAPWLDVYADRMEGWEPVLVEPFVVCDAIKAAGSPDRYLMAPDGEIYCADIKSGSSEPDYPLKVTMQVAIGSRAQTYDQATGKRGAIPCNQERGILIHVPIREGKPRIELYWLDLTKGWELAQLAYKVREARKLPKLEKIKD